MNETAAKSSFIADEPSVKPETQKGRTVLSDEIFAAVERGDIERVRALLSTTPELRNARDEKGNTPLLIAAREQRTEIGQLLLLKQADPDAKNDLGMTALMFAATNGNALLTEVLLQANADASLMNSTDATADDIARQHGNYALAARIQENQRMKMYEENEIRRAEEKKEEKKIESIFNYKAEEPIDPALPQDEFATSFNKAEKHGLFVSHFFKGMNKVADALRLSKFLRPRKPEAPKTPEEAVTVKAAAPQQKSTEVKHHPAPHAPTP